MKSFLLEIIADKINNCQKCDLHRYRNKPTAGDGNINALLMVVAMCPGEEEDKCGQVLVGPSGKLFTRWMDAINIDRKDIFHVNVARCHPPRNRQLEDNEIASCSWYLTEQIEIIQPQILLILGSVALKSISGDKNISIMRQHGKWFKYKDIDVLATYHPSFVLRQMTPESKKQVNSDLVKLRDRYNQLNGVK